jgi:hypothetical protein
MSEQDKASPILRTDALREAEYERATWVAKIERAVEFQEVLKPGFWAHHSNKFRPWDKIEARSEDGTWFAELLVLDCSRTWAKVHPLCHVKLSTPDTSQSLANMQEALNEGLKTYEVKFRGPRGWSVLRTADGSVIQEAIGSRDSAMAWLAAFVKDQKVPEAQTAKPT